MTSVRSDGRRLGVSTVIMPAVGSRLPTALLRADALQRPASPVPQLAVRT